MSLAGNSPLTPPTSGNGHVSQVVRFPVLPVQFVKVWAKLLGDRFLGEGSPAILNLQRAIFFVFLDSEKVIYCFFEIVFIDMVLDTFRLAAPARRPPTMHAA